MKLRIVSTRACAGLAAGMLAMGCASPEPQPGEIDASFWVQPGSFSPADDTLRFTAIFRTEELPDPSAFDVSVGGEPLTVDICGGEYHSCILRGAGPRKAPGEPYAFTLDLPWAEAVQSSIGMAASAEIIDPAPGTELSAQEVTTVTWSSTESGAHDSVVLSVDGGDTWPGVGAFDGGSSAVLTPDDFRDWLDGFERFLDLTPPFEAELILLRTHTASSSPPFRAGALQMEAVVARVPVVIVP